MLEKKNMEVRGQVNSIQDHKLGSNILSGGLLSRKENVYAKASTFPQG